MPWVSRADKGPGQGSRRDHAKDRPRQWRRWSRLALATAAATTLCPTARGAQVSWIDTVGGLWSENYRWSTFPDLPGVGDDVTINVANAVVQVKVNGATFAANSLTSQEGIVLESGELSLAAASVINGSFDFTGGTLSGSGDLTLNGASTWVNSTVMSGSGKTIVSSTGTMTITSGTYNKFLQRNLENRGTINFVIPDGFGSISMNNVVIDNKAGATFIADHAIDGFFYGEAGTTNRVNNDGTFIKRGVGAVYFGGPGSAPVPLINRGLVDVQGGTLILQTGTNHSGDFSVSSGATLRFEGGHTFEATSDITGAGQVYFQNNGDNLSNGTVNVTGQVLFAGTNTNTFNGAFHAASFLAPNGGTFLFNGATTLDQATVQNLTISGGGEVGISGASTWSGFGTMSGTGRTTITAGSTLDLVGGAGEKRIERRLDNFGTINWNGANVSASLWLTDGTIQNKAGATFNVNGDQYQIRGLGGTNAFVNAGVFNKGGTGIASFTGNGTSVVRFSNAGTVNVLAGALTFNGPFTNSGVVNLSGGTMTLNGGINNAGLLNITGGVLNLVAGVYTTAGLGNWQNTAGAQVRLFGILDNTASTLALNTNTGSLQLMAGSRIVGGTLSTAGGARLEIQGAATLDALTLAGAVVFQATNAMVVNGLTLGGGATLTLDADTNSLISFSGSQAIGGTGTITTSGTSSAVATLTGGNGDTLTLGPNLLVKPGTRDLTIGSGSSAVVVQGTLLADVGGRTLTVAGTSVQNLGTFEARNGATIDVTGALANWSAGGTLAGGTWRASAGGTLRVAGADIATNAAHVVMDGAAANFFNGPGTANALANLSVNAPAGDLTILNGYNFSGTSAFANSGRLTVGAGSAWVTPGLFTNNGTSTVAGSLSTTKTTNDGLMVVTGTHGVSADLVVGGTRAGGRYDLNGGALTVGGFATVGSGPAGAGTFNMTGGTFAVGKQLFVSTAGTNTSTFNLNSGAVTAGELFVAFFGGSQGVFNQTGGSVTLAGNTSVSTTGALAIGFSSLATTSGTYNQSGGTLTNQGVLIGYAGAGQFNQSGGTHTVGGLAGLSLAEFAGGAGSYSMSNGAVLNVAADERVGNFGAGTFTQAGGTHTVAGAIKIGANAGATGTFNHSGGTLTAGALNVLRGSFNQTGGTLTAGTTVNQAIYTQTGGAASLGNISGTGSVSVSGGALAAGFVRQQSLAITNDGIVNLATGAGASVVNVLAVSTGTSGGAALNLSNNALIVDYTGASVIGQVRAMVAGGRGTSAAHWTGSGVRSSDAAADPTLALAVAEASTVLGISGTQTAQWMGRTVDATSVLVRLTKLGDTNFDGRVSFGDFLRLEAGFGKPGGVWTTGDYNYDGVVDRADFKLLYDNYGQTVGLPAAPVPADDLRTLAALGATVPEPSGLALVALAGAAMTARRRRR